MVFENLKCMPGIGDYSLKCHLLLIANEDNVVHVDFGRKANNKRAAFAMAA